MPFRNKTVAALLAFLGGGIGAPWLYLRHRGWWLPLAITAISLPWLAGVKNWYQTPAFFMAMAPAIAGFIYALMIALMPDSSFDACFNRGLEQRNHSGWPVVLVAIATLLVGSTVTLSVIVLAIQTAVELSLAR
ncbi:MAG: hypothetical protein RR784_10975 [Burkholderiaceae bacterium]